MGFFSESVINFLITWKMLLLAIGLISLFNGNKTGGIILILISAFFIIPDFVEVSENIQKLYWPVGLIGLGAIIILRDRARNRRANFYSNNAGNQYFEDFVMFGGREQLLSSNHFEGAKTTSIFGGLGYDLTRCKISPDGATVDIFTLFGGTTLNLPPDWSVNNQVSTVFGGLNDERTKNPALRPNPEKTLTIRGLCLFGGIELESKNYPVE